LFLARKRKIANAQGGRVENQRLIERTTTTERKFLSGGKNSLEGRKRGPEQTHEKNGDRRKRPSWGGKRSLLTEGDTL